MFSIQEFSIENMKDPFGILSGDRYELLLDLEVEEDDELYLEEGVRLRVIYVKEKDGSSRIVKYEFLNASTNGYVDMEMEAEEEAFVDAFCKEQLELPIEE
ncbi:DUF6509 family protein [Paenibacillus sp. L3-i20]|uniref:DUF6509 family protein n=1 Tax=Paenibacillus sp. L3-i20 TaxID=2905833 RepID=UPI001EDD1E61|nr:DUF6509 family protein [Paenibacillus sp. L3-i20]GKU80438.1 hypothetical protein L3i20_v248350 [Paenibacillus sp. L3-i20]